MRQIYAKTKSYTLFCTRERRIILLQGSQTRNLSPVNIVLHTYVIVNRKGASRMALPPKKAVVHSTLTSKYTGSRYEPACAELRYPCAGTPGFPGRAAIMPVRNAGGSRTATTRRQTMRLPPSHRHKQWGRPRANHAEATTAYGVARRRPSACFPASRGAEDK